MINTTFTLTERDVATATRSVFLILFFRRMAWRMWLNYAGYGAGLAVFISCMHTYDPMEFKLVLWKNILLYAGLFLVMYALYFALAYAGCEKLAAKIVQTRKWFQEPVSISLDAERIIYGNSIELSNCRWQAYFGWTETALYLLLFFDLNRAQILPKRVLTGPHDLDHIRAWLTSSGVPHYAPFR